jgi:hypothetical protein
VTRSREGSALIVVTLSIVEAARRDTMGIGSCRVGALASVVLACALTFGSQAWAEDPAPSAPAVREAPPEIEPEVVEELRRAAELLANAKKLSVKAEVGYDVVQRDGQKIEFGSTRRILVRRPDHVVAEAEGRDGSQKRLFFDGQTLTFFDVGEEAYAVAPKPGDLDAAIDYLVNELGTPFPLSDLLRSDFAERVTNGLISARFAAEETLAGVPCDHLALRKQGADIQVWVENGERALIRRVVITYRDAPGEPQFWANLSDWNFAPDVSESRFAFSAPKGAEKIPFAPRAPLPPSSPQPTTGEQP